MSLFQKDNPSRSTKSTTMSSAVNQSTNSDLKTFLCPKCNRTYDGFFRNNLLVGRVPLLLPCSHTICEDCVRSCRAHGELTCTECNNTITVDNDRRNLQDIFPVNFYILGMIYYSRPGPGEMNLNFKPAGIYFNNRSAVPLTAVCDVTRPMHVPYMHGDADQIKCSRQHCNKNASLRCQDCVEVYCSSCSEAIHRAARGLQLHRIGPLETSNLPELTAMCLIHKTSVLEFQCTTCSEMLCCYCMVKGHTDHTYYQLTRLEHSDIPAFDVLIENAGDMLKRLHYTHKKISWQLTRSRVGDHSSSAEIQISKYFTYLYAKLQRLEKKLKAEANAAKHVNVNTLSELLKELTSNISSLTELITTAKNIHSPDNPIKVNVKSVIERLENALALPCYLVGDTQKTDNICFHQDDVLDNLEEHFTVTCDKEGGFYLAAEDELPDGYDTSMDEPTDIPMTLEKVAAPLSFETESNSSRQSSSLITPSELLSRALQPKRTSNNSMRRVENWLYNRPDEQNMDPASNKMEFDNKETVIVTHINTPEDFYVQINRQNETLRKFSKTMEKFVTSSFVPSVKYPKLNELYIVRYDTKSGKHWCRGRVIDLVQDSKKSAEPLYKIFFIDYGNTCTVKSSMIKEIHNDFLHLKPFALKCKLTDLHPYNQWEPKAMSVMAQILSGGQVIMVVMNRADGSLDVDLLVVAVEGDLVSVRDALIFMGHGIPYLKVNEEESCTEAPKISRSRVKLFKRSDSYQKGEEMKVLITHVIDPDNVYVQVADFTCHLQQLSNTMQKYYNEKSKAYVYNPRKDMVVAVRCNDVSPPTWYRGTVTDRTTGKGIVKVFLVDYGREVTVAWPSLKKLHERFTSLECQALLIKLADIEQPGVQETWAQNAIDFLNEYKHRKQILRMVVCHISQPVEVALFEPYSNMDICLNAMMVNNKLADSTGKIAHTVEWKKEETPKQVETPYTLKLMETIQGSRKPQENTDKDQSHVVKLPIRVLKVINPGLIYVSLDNPNTKRQQSELHKNLQEYYYQNGTKSNKWNLDDPCVVYNARKQLYYRGIVKEKFENKTFKIWLPDYADEIVVTENDLYILVDKFTSYADGTIKCHLTGMKPAGDSKRWSAMAVEFLQDVLFKHKNIYFTKSGSLDKENKNSLPVIMWYSEFLPGGALEPSQTLFHTVNKLLISNGLALRHVPPESAEDAQEKRENEAARSEEGPTKSSTSGRTNEPINQRKKLARGGRVATYLRSSRNAAKQKSTQNSVQPDADEKPATDSRADGLQSVAREAQSNDLVDDFMMKKSKSLESFVQRPSEPSATVTSFSATNSPMHVTENQGKSENWNDMIEKELDRQECVKAELTESKSNTATFKDEIAAPSHPVAFTYSQTNLKNWLPALAFTNNIFDAVATYVDEDACIYIHTVDSEPALKEMEDSMKAYFDDLTPEPEHITWQKGQLCTVKYFANEKWYRGKITQITDDCIKVLMIDYGNEEDCKHEDLRTTILYTDLPAFANKIKLDHVFCKNRGKWLTSELDDLHRTVVDKKINVLLTNRQRGKRPTPAIVTVNGVIVNNYMIENFANLSCYPVSSRSVKRRDSEDDVVIETELSFEAPQSSSLASAAQPNETSSNAAEPQPESERKNFIFPQLQEKQKLPVAVVNILNYNKFVLEMDSVETFEETKTLFNAISDDIKQCAETQPVLYDIQFGQPCIAKYSEDNEWYRAQIFDMEKASSGFINVWFVDFGNFGIVPRDLIRAMKPQWFKMPVYHYVVTIHGIKLAEDSCLNDVVTYMSEFYDNIKLAEVVSIEPISARLYDIDTDKLAYQDLIDRGLLVADSL